MTARSRFFTIVSILLLCSFFVSSASAAPAAQVVRHGSTYPPEFRETFTRYAAWLDSNGSQGLSQQLQAMSDEEFQALYDSFVDPEKTMALMEQVMSSTSTASRKRVLIAPQLTPRNSTKLSMSINLYPPDYPVGSSYNDWVASLLGAGYLADLEGDGTTANDRCNTDKVASNESLKNKFEGAAITADTLCNSIVVFMGEGTNGPACIAAGAAHGLVLGQETIINKCSFQDGSVDSAELEASYENSKVISSQVDDVSTQLVDISTQLDDLSTQLQIHDTDIKNILAANQAQSIKIEIEQALSDTNDNVRVSYFYLPEAQGGLLETIRQVVLDEINANALAGLATGNAQAWFARAEASFAGKDYKSAYDSYGKAYRELVK